MIGSFFLEWGQRSWGVALVSRPKSYSFEPLAQDGGLEPTATEDCDGGAKV